MLCSKVQEPPGHFQASHDYSSGQPVGMTAVPGLRQLSQSRCSKLSIDRHPLAFQHVQQLVEGDGGDHNGDITETSVIRQH